MDNTIRNKTVFLCTFGCQMNEADSELVRGILGRAGYDFVEDDREADVILLNTCSVRDNAHRKVFGHIHELRHRRAGRPAVVGILGCMATGLREDLLADKGLGLGLVAGPDSYKRLPQLIASAQGGGGGRLDVGLSALETYEDVVPVRTPGVNAWVPVMRGCDNFCAFCIVPYTRGRERSRPVSGIIEEVRVLAGEGFPQVTLLGQNVNSYRDGANTFADLLEAVASVPGIRRVRFTSPHPKDFPEALVRVIGGNPRVCKQVHLPLQAGNDRVLALMRRGYTGDVFLRLVDRLRDACPGMSLSTDIIVGFPTETEAEFADTLRIVRDVCFDSAFMFKYSPRPNTQAVRELKDDVSEEAKTDRIVRLNALQTDMSLACNQRHVGAVQEVLVESGGATPEDTVQARNDANRVVLLPAGSGKTGQFLNVRIVRATPHQLKGEPVPAEGEPPQSPAS